MDEKFKPLSNHPETNGEMMRAQTLEEEMQKLEKDIEEYTKAAGNAATEEIAKGYHELVEEIKKRIEIIREQMRKKK